MPIREIVTPPNPVLRRKARRVTDFGPELQSLIDDMLETMRAAPGVGLAAPQVNLSLRLFVAEWGDDEDPEAPKRTYVVVNPELKKQSAETEKGVEGCLSLPGLLGEVERSLEVTLKAQNRRGQPTRIKARGWLARILQHEFDHLDGVLFIDRTDEIWHQTDEDGGEGGPAADGL